MDAQVLLLGVGHDAPFPFDADFRRIRPVTTTVESPCENCTLVLPVDTVRTRFSIANDQLLIAGSAVPVDSAAAQSFAARASSIARLRDRRA